jgi:hypothetical protein
MAQRCIQGKNITIPYMWYFRMILNKGCEIVETSIVEIGYNSRWFNNSSPYSNKDEYNFL